VNAPTREVPPALHHRSPDCSICGEEVSHDGDSFYCEHCNAYWPEDSDDGAWNNDTAEQCASTHQPLARNQFAKGKPYQFETRRCLLDAGHETPHRSDAVTTWSDETAVNGLGAAATEDGAA
jgi:hypothetical protein